MHAQCHKRAHNPSVRSVSRKPVKEARRLVQLRHRRERVHLKQPMGPMEPRSIDKLGEGDGNQRECVRRNTLSDPDRNGELRERGEARAHANG